MFVDAVVVLVASLGGVQRLFVLSVYSYCLMLVEGSREVGFLF